MLALERRFGDLGQHARANDIDPEASDGRLFQLASASKMTRVKADGV
jgi:hypothetical protein